MGLVSSMTTALTGMSAAETQVDVVGNNLANSQTVGFKESEAAFATQLYLTQSAGSPPTPTNGGTNPRQIGLGTRVAEITPKFTQGSVEISSSPSDLAIQGDGFFIVESSEGEHLYTRNGIFKLNAANELVSVTGERLLGYGVSDDFLIQQTSLVPLTIPLGTAMVARATESVTFQGVLTPTGDIADTAGAVQTAALEGPGGATLTGGTLLVDVVNTVTGTTPIFEPGTLEFTPRKDDRTLATKSFQITGTSTVQDLLTFMQEAVGIQTTAQDPLIPTSLNNIPTESGTLSPGISIVNGQIRIVSNNGTGNFVELDESTFRLTSDATGSVTSPDLGFATLQDPVGESAIADFLAYDSLGTPVNVRVTAVLESATDNTFVYRWFADSGDNSPFSGNDIAVGTGLITFDGEGNFVSTTNDVVNVQRLNLPSLDPLSFELDFSEVSGLSAPNSELSAARQDGSPPGTLTGFIVGEDGIIRGVFTSGVTRDLGQVRLARFANPEGLVQRGDNMYGQGLNSGLPIEGNPDTVGLGSIIGGALELSNTDIGKNLIDLVLATTMYRGNARVISTAQELLDELMNLRR
jgi:flagellar hook-basal body protein